MHQSVRVIADMSFLRAVSDVQPFHQTKSIVEMDLGPTLLKSRLLLRH
jgi:hypothetical protein